MQEELLARFAELTRKGQWIGANDLLIAAHARALGLTLVTNNGREFERVAGLKVENWDIIRYALNAFPRTTL